MTLLLMVLQLFWSVPTLTPMELWVSAESPQQVVRNTALVAQVLHSVLFAVRTLAIET